MIPMLPLVPLPTLITSKMDFSLEVNESTLSKNTSDSSFETSVQCQVDFGELSLSSYDR